MKRIIFIAIVSLVGTFAYGQEGKKEKNQEEVERVFTPEETWFLPTGFQMRATILNAIFSFNLVTPVIAILDEPAKSPKDGRVILPAKTRLIGTADILKSDDRVNIRFLVAVLPNGREFELSGIALSSDGSAGIKGEKKEHKDAKLMASALSGALSGAGQVAGLAMTGQPMVAGAVVGALQQGSQQASEISQQRVDVSIFVPPFQKVQIFLMKRLLLDELLKLPAPSQKEKKTKDGWE